MFLLTPILIFVSVTLFSLFLWSNRRLYELSWKLPGPVALPIIGNGIQFMGDPIGNLHLTIIFLFKF